MKRTAMAMGLALALLALGLTVQAAERAVDFKPAASPSVGPENARVTVVEIADFL